MIKNGCKVTIILFNNEKVVILRAMKLKTDIKTLFGEIIDFIKEDFNPWAYLYTAVVVTVLIIVAYPLNGYRTLIAPLFWNNTSWWALPLIYYGIYMLVAIPNLLIRKDYVRLKDKRFYLKPLLFIWLFAFSIGYTFYGRWFNSPSLTNIDSYFLRWCWIYFDGILLVVVPLALYKYFFDKKIEGIYGLCRRTQYLPVYLTALLFILPFVAAASFLPDFQSYYPRLHPERLEGAMGLPQWAVTSIFEFCYGADFITTEVFFRGAMVIGMSAILGPRAVLPMCVFYCSVHFGKPMLESISAIFGGYLLGILAYRTKHIWGGVCAHLGIAFMMEIMGLIHLFARL